MTLSIPNEGPHCFCDGHDDYTKLTEDVNQEIIMVTDTNTVIHPRAVMVKPFYTLVADGTVPRTRGADAFTVRTKGSAVEDSYQIIEIHFVDLFNVSRLGTVSHE